MKLIYIKSTMEPKKSGEKKLHLMFLKSNSNNKLFLLSESRPSGSYSCREVSPIFLILIFFVQAHFLIEKLFASFLNTCYLCVG